MLQISAGRFFRPDVQINEHPHRRTVYSNAWFPDPTPVDLPVGTITGSTDIGDVSTAMLEAVDRLEAQRWDGTDEFMVATGGDNLVDDVLYVMTFVLNRTFSRNHDRVRRLVPPEGLTGRSRGAASLFPHLFDPRQVIQPGEWDDLKQFMNDLLALHREDFAPVMRVIRNAVDATRRAIDDPTGAYTDLRSTRITWRNCVRDLGDLGPLRRDEAQNHRRSPRRRKRGSGREDPRRGPGGRPWA